MFIEILHCCDQSGSPSPGQGAVCGIKDRQLFVTSGIDIEFYPAAKACQTDSICVVVISANLNPVNSPAAARFTSMAKLIFGCGYLGLRVAEKWTKRGQQVYAVTRSAHKAQELAATGIVPVLADLTSPASLASATWPSDLETVVFAVGYGPGSKLSIGEVYVQGLTNVLAALPDSVPRFIYISSTGVYGDAAGEWVDEETPCRPTRAGGRASLAAEELLRGDRFGKRSVILRLAGLYGPGRIPRAASLMRGEPIDAPSEGFLNLIHVEDAAAIVVLAESKAPLPRTYVVSDGQPVVRGEYYRELARLLDAPAPQFAIPDPNTPAAQRAASDKRICNRRLMNELAPKFLNPSYRQGLAAIVAAQHSSAGDE